MSINVLYTLPNVSTIKWKVILSWKIEKWFEEVFPGEENIYLEYKNLNPRELAIVSSGVCDLALAELISLRLHDGHTECSSFLGANGDGRAPVASFGSRIQLAYLLFIISKQDVRILRTIKSIRNSFAHKVNVTFTDKDILKQLRVLGEEWKTMSINIGMLDKHKSTSLDSLLKIMPTESAAGEALLLSVFTVYQAYFHRIRNRIARIDKFIKS